LLSLDGPVNGEAGHSQQVRQFSGGVLTGIQRGNQMSFLTVVEFGLLASEAPLGFRDFHILSGPRPDEVGGKLGNHGEDIEEQLPDRIGVVQTMNIKQLDGSMNSPSQKG
jgi:hypothetical protein